MGRGEELCVTCACYRPKKRKKSFRGLAAGLALMRSSVDLIASRRPVAVGFSRTRARLLKGSCLKQV